MGSESSSEDAKELLKANRKGRWYDAGVRFRCLAPECSRCCTGAKGEGYVWISAVEMEAMAEHLSMEFDDFTRRYIRQIDYAFSLIEKPNHDCVFLEGGKCSVYEVRPTQCRTYPYWPEIMESRAKWDKEAAQCPGIGEGDVIHADEIDSQLAIDREARKRNNAG